MFSDCGLFRVTSFLFSSMHLFMSVLVDILLDCVSAYVFLVQGHSNRYSAFFFQKNADIFLTSPRKHTLWVLFKSTSARRF